MPNTTAQKTEHATRPRLQRLRTSLLASLQNPRVWGPMLGLALLVLCLAYWFGLRNKRSIQGFVNTSVIVMRAPVAGALTLAPTVQVGQTLHRGTPFGSIAADLENPRMSQLRIQAQELATRAGTLAEQIAGTENTVSEKQRQLAQYTGESKSQRQWQVEYGEAVLKTARQEYQRSAIQAGTLGQEAARARRMYEHGFISEAGLQTAEGAERAAVAAVGVQQARMTQSELSLKAYAAGLQLDGPRTLSEPDSRIRQLRADLVDLAQQRNNRVRELGAVRAEQGRVDEELASLRIVALSPPKDGVIWSIAAQPGEHVGTEGEVLQMVSCDNVWVEGFFDEADSTALAVGDQVRVRMLHGGRNWRGRVETIRSGAGRVNVGQYVVDPPPEIARRQLPVRVSTVRVRVDWNGALDPGAFCLAGSSVQVLLD
jgi:multidrug resistance efflux pump